MSLASSVPCYKLHSSSSSPSFCSNTNFPSSSSSSVRIKHFVVVRNSKAEGPLRRPLAPPLREPSAPTVKPLSPSPPSPPPTSKSVSTVIDQKNSLVVSVEFQRKMAKELQDYFRQKKIEEADKGPFFGFRAKNEISNGRWAMFGFAVGMLTEYATGSDFVDQLKILLSNFGIVDLE